MKKKLEFLKMDIENSSDKEKNFARRFCNCCQTWLF